VKGDILNMFSDFYEGRLDLFRLNFAIVNSYTKSGRCH
jgi:hypothetical protein